MSASMSDLSSLLDTGRQKRGRSKFGGRVGHDRLVDRIDPRRRQSEAVQTDTSVVRLKLSAVRIGGGPRIGGLDNNHIRSLAEVDTPLPPIIVRRVSLDVVDGAHRVLALKLRGESEVDAVIFDGEENEAFALAVKINTRHGLPLSKEERQAATARLIEMYPSWSDRRISQQAGVSPTTVALIRRCSSVQPEHLHARVGRDGRRRPIDTRPGRQAAAEILKKEPSASLREIARQAGVSPGTVRDVRRRIQAGESPLTTIQQHADAGRTSTPAKGIQPQTRVPAKGQRAKIFGSLLADPSLRYSQVGRVFLRSIEATLSASRDWESLAAALPPHCVPFATEVAVECAELWRHLATLLAATDNRPVTDASVR